jgi:multifunctional methyltransferase subunit TRM112
MRLLTHNYLQSNVKGTEKGYPLLIEPTKLEYEESPFDPDFVKALLPKINYEGLLFAQRQISEKCAADLSNEFQMPELPESIDENIDETVLKNLHDVMFDIHVVEGALICPDTGRRFMINMGIPNMILHEDEI